MTIGIILTTLGVFELFVGLYFLLKYQRSPAILFYALFAFGSAIYVGANGLGYTFDSYLLGERASWIGGILATTFFLPFSMSYPYSRHSYRELLPWVVWPILVFGFGTAFTELFIRNIGAAHFAYGYKTSTGDFFWLLLVFIGMYWVWSIFNILKSMRSSVGVQRRLTMYILLGTTVSLLASISFDIIVPLIFVSRIGYLGSLMNAAWLGTTTYILLKKP